MRPTHSGRLPSFTQTILALTWLLAITVALTFVAIKIRSWGTLIDAPEQGDFFVYYYAARISERDPQLLYHPQEWYKSVGLEAQNLYPFLYMPGTAVLIQPLSRLPIEIARRLWFWASVLCIVGSVALLAPRMSGFASVLGVMLLTLSPPMLDTLFLGQINGFLALFTSLSCLGINSANHSRRVWSGVLLGLSLCVKPIAAGLLLLAIMRRRTDFILGSAIGAVAFIAIGLVALPLSLTKQFFGIASGTASGLAPPSLNSFWNQGVPAFWSKLLGEQHADMARLLALVSIGALLLVTISILRKDLRARQFTNLHQTAIVLLTGLLCSPLTWWHYLLITIPVYFSIAEAYYRASHPIWKTVVPLGFLLIVLLRAAERIVPVTGIQIVSSLMTAGMLLWFLLLARLPGGAAEIGT